MHPSIHTSSIKSLSYRSCPLPASHLSGGSFSFSIDFGNMPLPPNVDIKDSHPFCQSENLHVCCDWKTPVKEAGHPNAPAMPRNLLNVDFKCLDRNNKWSHAHASEEYLRISEVTVWTTLRRGCLWLFKVNKWPSYLFQGRGKVFTTRKSHRP